MYTKPIRSSLQKIKIIYSIQKNYCPKKTAAQKMAHLWQQMTHFWHQMARFWHKMAPLRAYRRRVSCVMHTSCIHVRAWTGRKGEKLKKCCFLKHCWRGQRSHDDSRAGWEPASRAILGSLWSNFWCIRVTLGHYRITLGSVWSHFGCLRSNFKKHSFSQ